MPTLTPSLILQPTLDAYTALFPYMGRFGTDFSAAAPLLLNQTVTAHIRIKPTKSTYDATTGYANGATESRDLLIDMPILVDKHEHVPIKLSHLYAIADQKESFAGSMADCAEVIGKSQVDSITNKFKGSNVSYSQTATEANSDLDVIEQLTTDMNINRANPRGRVGLINSNVAQALGLDSRVASKDYYGALPGSTGSGLRMFRNVGGFEALYEYPELSLNNATGATFTTTHTTELVNCTAHGYATGDRVRLTTSAADLPAGFAVDTTYYVIRVSADTLKLASSDANATAGTAVAISDDGTGTHTITGYENVTGIFCEPQAIAFRAGIPSSSHEQAAALGIPVTMGMDVMSAPNSGFSLALMKWMQPGTANVYVSPTSIWGSAVGRQAGAAAYLTDRSAIILRKA